MPIPTAEKAEQLTEITSLEAKNITKRFPGVLACDDISLSVKKNEILALVGENGAGKTTLMNILMGLYNPDEGEILINGEAVNFRTPKDAFSRGIGMVHQHYMLVPNLTVLENIALGMPSARKFGLLRKDAVRRAVDEVRETYGLAVEPDAYIWQLSIGEQQRVELVKTICLGARFLILDEPTSALTPQETDELIELLKGMSKTMSVIFISHKLQEVKNLSHKTAVLRHGRVVFTGNTDTLSSQDIAAHMTGSAIEILKNEKRGSTSDNILEIRDLTVESDRGYPALDSFSLSVRRGEIMGLAGVSGNGQRELAQALNGLRKTESGSIIFDGTSIENLPPGKIISLGMGYIPEDRNTEGIIPGFSIKENLILKDCESEDYCRNMFLKLDKIDESANSLKERFDIRCPDTGTQAGALSGGNIQKVILAREINRNPKFLIAVYPIRGLDMGAAEFIHKELLILKERGVGILLISEELDEIMNLSDRIAVIYKGRVMNILKGGEATKQQIGLHMAGVEDDG